MSQQLPCYGHTAAAVKPHGMFTDAPGSHGKNSVRFCLLTWSPMTYTLCSNALWLMNCCRHPGIATCTKPSTFRLSRYIQNERSTYDNSDDVLYWTAELQGELALQLGVNVFQHLKPLHVPTLCVLLFALDADQGCWLDKAIIGQPAVPFKCTMSLFGEQQQHGSRSKSQQRIALKQKCQTRMLKLA